MNVLIAVPAYDEEDSIEIVIKSIVDYAPECDYIVINDGSSDHTVELCKKIGAPFIDLPVNLGLGGAFGCAMRYANEKKYDAIVQIDGDGQHNPQYIKNLVEAMESSDCDIVIGSRYLTDEKATTVLRGMGGKLITWLLRIKTHKLIKDPTSGMRLYNSKIIKLFCENDFFEPEPHTLAYLLKQGYKIEETPVTMKEREAGKSYLGGLKAARYMLRVCLSIILV